MKDGRTRLAHKADHAVDVETGAVVGVIVQDADAGDKLHLRLFPTVLLYQLTSAIWCLQEGMLFFQLEKCTRLCAENRS